VLSSRCRLAAGAGAQIRSGRGLRDRRLPDRGARARNSKAVGLTLRGFEREIEDSARRSSACAQRGAHDRAARRAAHPRGDILVLEADVDALAEALSVFDIKLEEQSIVENRTRTTRTPPRRKPPREAGEDAKEPTMMTARTARATSDIVLRELAVLPGSTIVGRSASGCGCARATGSTCWPSRAKGRRRGAAAHAEAAVGRPAADAGPGRGHGRVHQRHRLRALGERDLRIPTSAWRSVAARSCWARSRIVTLGLLPAAAAFALGVLASMLLRTVPPRRSIPPSTGR
jgi:hypothetical protein